MAVPHSTGVTNAWGNYDMTPINTHAIPGFVELLPEEQLLFERMKASVEKSYRLFGFAPIDTPTIERLDILLGKVGGETSKQIYRISRDGDEQGLRFDLTVPLARYVAEHYANLSFPFRRYHIAKVFRGERPQKGRFREFFQADIDIIGAGELSLVNDAEMVAVINHTFRELGLSDYVIRISNRKILTGFWETFGDATKDVAETLRIIDKLEKIGIDAVKTELTKLGVNLATAEKLVSLVSLKGDASKIIPQLEAMQISNETFALGIRELQEIFGLLQAMNVPSQNYMLDLSIARGLDYYTGTVYETTLSNCPGLGSICSGGRYDNLAEHYTDKKLPGVGISIGLSRLFSQLLANGFLQPKRATPAEILILPLGDDLKYTMRVASLVRAQGIPTQVFMEHAKPKKKFAFADKQKFDFVIVIGEDEEKEEAFSLKNLATGEQAKYPLSELPTVIKNVCS